MPPATAAEAPPEEPPEERAVSQGLRVLPKRVFSATVIGPNSGVLVRPQRTKPAASRVSASRAAARAPRPGPPGASC